MKRSLYLLLVLIVSSTAMGFEGDNDPRFMDANYQRSFKSLPLHGRLTTNFTPWSSSFWPHIYGGIAFRWNNYYQDAPLVRKMQHEVTALKDEVKALKKELFTTVNPTPQLISKITSKMVTANNQKQIILRDKANEHKRLFFDIKRPRTLNDVRAMKQEELDQLSAAEKYDIYRALVFGYSGTTMLTNNVLQLTKPYSAYWEGICDGWASASIEFYEPKPKSVSINGITVNFGSSDLKALLSYYHAAMTSNLRTASYNKVGRVGVRCNTEFPEEAWILKDGKEYYKSVVGGKIVTKPVPHECLDVNAGAFHIVVANQLALKGQGFIVDIVRDIEIWNQPVFAYDTQIINETNNIRPNATYGTTKQVHVKTKIQYSNDGGRMFWQQDDPEEEFYAWWDPTNGTTNFRKTEKEFEYIIDINGAGKIIGGMWLSYERPDFLWVKKSKGFIGTGRFFGIVGYMNELRNLVKVRK